MHQQSVKNTFLTSHNAPGRRLSCQISLQAPGNTAAAQACHTGWAEYFSCTIHLDDHMHLLRLSPGLSLSVSFGHCSLLHLSQSHRITSFGSRLLARRLASGCMPGARASTQEWLCNWCGCACECFISDLPFAFPVLRPASADTRSHLGHLRVYGQGSIWQEEKGRHGLHCLAGGQRPKSILR